MDKTEYKVLVEYTSETFDKECNKLSAEGWFPYAPMTFVYREATSTKIYTPQIRLYIQQWEKEPASLDA